MIGRQPATAACKQPLLVRGGGPGVARRPKERGVRVRIRTLALSTPLFFGLPSLVGLFVVVCSGGTGGCWWVPVGVLVTNGTSCMQFWLIKPGVY